MPLCCECIVEKKPEDFALKFLCKDCWNNQDVRAKHCETCGDFYFAGQGCYNCKEPQGEIK